MAEGAPKAVQAAPNHLEKRPVPRGEAGSKAALEAPRKPNPVKPIKMQPNLPEKRRSHKNSPAKAAEAAARSSAVRTAKLFFVRFFVILPPSHAHETRNVEIR